jgi:3-methyladenine DNA glycosylase/8-oxoguanine DNA glycosylase
VSEDSSRAVRVKQARSYLRNADPVLARLIDDRPDFDPRAWMAQLPPLDLYGALLFQVIGQQLSIPATRRTLARIQALFGGHLPAPAELLAVDPGQLRQAGLSWRKIGTLRDLAERLTRVRSRVGVGEPACEERVVLQGGDPAVPQPVGKASGHGGGWFLPIAQAGEEYVQEPVGEGLGLPDRRKSCP